MDVGRNLQIKSEVAFALKSRKSRVSLGVSSAFTSGKCKCKYNADLLFVPRCKLMNPLTVNAVSFEPVDRSGEPGRFKERLELSPASVQEMFFSSQSHCLSLTTLHQ